MKLAPESPWHGGECSQLVHLVVGGSVAQGGLVVTVDGGDEQSDFHDSCRRYQ